MNLEKLLRPASIAVVGASEKEGFGGDACRNILTYMKDCSRVYFVNPKRDLVFGKKCYRSLEEIEDVLDLLLICTPQKTVIPLLKNGAAKGCGGAVVFASGYSEVGTAEGRQNERDLCQAAEELGIALMGPNCAGFVNYVDNVQAFAFISEKRDQTGCVGMVSQSGQLCLSMMDDPSMRFSYCISAGNGNVVRVEDYMDFLVDDNKTKVVGVYLEGVRDTEKFSSVLRKAALKKKPVIILKTGRSAKGSEIAASHTGSLSGSERAFDAVLEKFGVVRVDDLQELVGMSSMLSTLPRLPHVPTFAPVSLSGGETGICADVAARYGVCCPDFAPETLENLKKQLPDYATPNNPLDMTATLSYDEELYAKALRTVMDDPNIGMVLMGYTLLYEISDPAIRYMYKGIEKLIKAGNCKPMALVPFLENTRNPEFSGKLFELGVPILPPTSYAFKILKNLSNLITYCPGERSLELRARKRRASGSLCALSEFESKLELERYGFTVEKGIVTTSVDEALSYASGSDGSFALKVDSADILHKSDIGGVKLNIAGEEAMRRAYEEILRNVAERKPGAKVNGITVAPMLRPGVEVIVGVDNDPQFGPIVMVGMGGVFVELFKDMVFYPAPLNLLEARKMLESLRAFRLLEGYRKSGKCDIDALCRMIVAIGDYAAENGDSLKELDINPLFVYPEGEGTSIADALIVKYKDNSDMRP